MDWPRRSTIVVKLRTRSPSDIPYQETTEPEEDKHNTAKKGPSGDNLAEGVRDFFTLREGLARWQRIILGKHERKDSLTQPPTQAILRGLQLFALPSRGPRDLNPEPGVEVVPEGLKKITNNR